jgi:hypothetical protein
MNPIRHKVQSLRVIAVKKIILVIATILILAASVTTYLYFMKQPVESIPNRATLVLNNCMIIEREGDIYVELAL